MSDEDYDPCEYVYNSQMQMRRLLSWLRGSQTTCTEEECFSSEGPLGDGGSGSLSDSMVLAMGALWVVVALGLYYMRLGLGR
ncbi:Protein C34C124, partial [Caligus rogercresseyi]